MSTRKHEYVNRKQRRSTLQRSKTPKSIPRPVVTSVQRGKKAFRGRRGGGYSASRPMEKASLTYTATYHLTSASSTGFRAYYILTNGSQVDPFISSSTPGLSSYFARYASYRIRSYHGTVQFANSTLQNLSTPSRYVPLTGMVCHSNTTLGITPTTGGAAINLIPYSSLAKNQEKTIGAPSSPNTIIPFRRTILSVTGENVMQSSYKALGGAIPASPTYLAFGINWDPTGLPIVPPLDVIDCEVTVRLTQDFEFLDYVDTLTSFEGLKMCAACQFLQEREYVPCICSTRGACINCGSTRPCSEEFPLPTCPREKLYMDVRAPTVEYLLRSKSAKDLFRRDSDNELEARLSLAKDNSKQITLLEERLKHLRSKEI